ncbi:MAG: hypothetical protein P8188_01600, partial [Gemmatimonadota bacterium]
ARAPFSDGGEARQSIEIEVRNMNFNQATLWAVRFGERIRLGIVEGKQDETFRIEWRTSAPMQIEIRLLGGDRCVTRSMTVDPGDALYLEVASDLATDPECT